ncbi:hypothetical protein BZA05DRAFT_416742 [Tricharina praecox]|uniref:uncharacterized protein n=1 Tax=Tricharina praecox TaxID=43433 RepID=UPI00221E43B4|nr:uncharacterized protein BZA05DRAFT_416742 [Tricharina praecox]KAI5855148.1 hypothetical protein BZA05DRAFT_416742 [Tricharina praecox]
MDEVAAQVTPRDEVAFADVDVQMKDEEGVGIGCPMESTSADGAHHDHCQQSVRSGEVAGAVQVTLLEIIGKYLTGMVEYISKFWFSGLRYGWESFCGMLSYGWHMFVAWFTFDGQRVAGGVGRKLVTVLTAIGFDLQDVNWPEARDRLIHRVSESRSQLALTMGSRNWTVTNVLVILLLLALYELSFYLNNWLDNPYCRTHLAPVRALTGYPQLGVETSIIGALFHNTRLGMYGKKALDALGAICRSIFLGFLSVYMMTFTPVPFPQPIFEDEHEHAHHMHAGHTPFTMLAVPGTENFFAPPDDIHFFNLNDVSDHLSSSDEDEEDRKNRFDNASLSARTLANRSNGSDPEPSTGPSTSDGQHHCARSARAKNDGLPSPKSPRIRMNPRRLPSRGADSAEPSPSECALARKMRKAREAREAKATREARQATRTAAEAQKAEAGEATKPRMRKAFSKKVMRSSDPVDKA